MRVRRSCLLLLVLLMTACGTRLPDRDFAGQAAGVTGPTQGPSLAPGVGPTAGPAATAGPQATATAALGPGQQPAPGASRGPRDAANTASDVGVTATTIRLGTISSRTNAFDPTAFVGPTYGVQAFVDDLNRRGGVRGRKVQLFSCDDHGDGSRNNACVHQLLDTDKVFALVSNSIFSYAGASYVQGKGVPDIGGQPIDTAYDRFSHLWDLYGEAYPRNGTVGYNGQLEGGTEVYRFFKERFPKVPLKAGVVYYNQGDSQRFADNLTKGLRKEGYAVIDEEVNFALPNYDAAVLDMKNQGVTYVYDALDAGGNQNLCASMDSNGLSPQLNAKVTTTQSWVASIGQQYSQSPTCRNKIWTTGNTLNYEDTRYPQVKAFRDAMALRHTDGPDQLSEWALEGWAGGQWLADAMASCGARLTRTCVEGYMSRHVKYDGHGLLTPRDFVKYPHRAHTVNCINVARWQDSARGGRGGWATQVPDMAKSCWDVPAVLYSP